LKDHNIQIAQLWRSEKFTLSVTTLQSTYTPGYPWRKGPARIKEIVNTRILYRVHCNLEKT